ncbi:alpha/beta fold hydrolase [Pseudenhygromyxa sp. WMMC2535]|uniref:alpha/beta fold hydrolase n=1 Tax=Pseudenhygromyxa sp. WMMC2535 TaxID=2712867 RepID=UPI001554800A|nr:alpha/beta fold hydrolase [Pseudenhygromyxa sp. WMMC2535]NVB37781.1 alpha/beta fold hydrolase [Pseudenhygromyxa sp. WMMC2535]
MTNERPTKPTRLSTTLLSLALAFATSACDLQAPSEQHELQTRAGPSLYGESDTTPWAERGRLVAFKRVDVLSRQEIRAALYDLPFIDAYADFGLEDFTEFYTAEEIDEVVRNRVAVYQVIYETVDPWGQPTTASGAVLMPLRKGKLAQGRALWGLQRGTVFHDADVPSSGEMVDWGIWRGLLPAAAGYVTAMPDYLGFGASRHMVHPYSIAEPTATASVDMLRATRNLADELGVSLREEVFLSGHSQGGHATLATQRMIEAEYAEEFELAGVSVADGAYALSGVATALLESETLIAPQVTAMLTLGIAGVYELDQPLSYYFEPPYDELVLELYDKIKDNAEIIAGLPSGATSELYTEAFLADFRGEGAQGFKAALALNDVHVGWSPDAPLRLYHGELDEVIPAAMAPFAAASLAGPGTQIEVELFEGAGHLQSIVPSTLASIHWFDSLTDEGY